MSESGWLVVSSYMRPTPSPIRTGITLLAALGVMMISIDAAKPAADTPLRLSFSNSETDGIAGDGFTAPGYADGYVHGVENVLAIIQPSGNLRFGTQSDTRQAATRRVCLDFGNQFAEQQQLVPFTDGQTRQCVNVMQPMHALAAGDVSIASLRYGQSVAKLTRFEWDDADYRYRLGYGTDLDRNSVPDSPPVRVTCIAPVDTATPCQTWALTPSTDGEAVLFRYKTRRGTVLEDTGEFVAPLSMPFAQTFVRK